jgi:radical SAM/Cys-rich protein
MEPEKQLNLLADVPGGVSFEEKLGRPLSAETIEILQLNIGRQCNLMCKHCHVEAGPQRAEIMTRPVLEKCLEILTAYPIGTIDITGGSPEMNPHLDWFLQSVSTLGRRVLVRSNLAILAQAEYRHFLDLYADLKVEVVTSLPDPRAQRTDRQRGRGVYDLVVRMMRQLNDRGYGRPDSGLILDLVYNPVGAYLPGSQTALARTYHEVLARDHGLVFNHLFCLGNCPVGRYLEYLVESDNYEAYMTELINAFNWAAVDRLMCRSTLSVGWQGKLYDCDFNQMLELPVDHGAPAHVDIFDFERLKNRRIVLANHCYACTAGSGSSCQGALDHCCAGP